ncbi:MAG TPA: histidine phosphatase family protein [Gaiellaceae bacterium]|nr:histidine phosphatase family protein [Gaiellaceae bacterium]
MRQLLLARHGESVFSVEQRANGDPGVPGPLTDTGRAQARALGEALADRELDLVAVTEFERVRETAELAVGDRGLPVIVIPELNEPRYGVYDGAPLEAYLRWAWSSGPLERPPGGEHRGGIAMRHAAGYRKLLERAEDSILFVGHSLGIRYVLDAAAGRPPAAKAEPVEYATVHRLSHGELERAIDVLDVWAGAPQF